MTRRISLLLLLIACVALPGAQLVKTINGLAIASAKTDDDLAIASVKSVMGLDNTAGVTTPTYDSGGTGATVAGNTLTITVSAGALTNGYVVVDMTNLNTTSAPATVVDNDLGSYSSLVADTSLGIYTGRWGLAKGTRSSGNLIITATWAAPPSGQIGVTVYNAVKQTGSTRTSSDTSSTGAVSTTVTTVSGDLVTDYVTSTGALSSPGAGQTSRYNDSANVASSTKTATTTSTTMTWTNAGTSYVSFATPLVPAN